MTVAVIAAAIALLIASAFFYWRRGGWGAHARLDVDRPAAAYEALGRASRSPGGSGRSEPSFAGDMESACGDAFLGLVVDGMGEAAEAERARSLVLEALLTAVRGNAPDVGRTTSPGAHLKGALDAAHRTVQEAAAERGLDAFGASVAAIVIDGEGLHWVSTGNGRVCLYRDEILHQVTLDHTFGTLLAKAVMRGQLSPADAAAKQERDALTSYVGGAEAPDIDASRRPFPLRDGDRVIVCTHGLHTRLSAEEMADVVRSGPSDVSAALVERALAAAPPSAGTVAAVDFLYVPAPDAARASGRPRGSSGSRTTVRVTRPSAGAEEVAV